MELHITMQFNHSIILLGNSGSGKTVCYQTLCRALCQFYSTWSQEVKKRRQRKLGNTNPQSESSSFSKVNLSVLYPKTVTHSEVRIIRLKGTSGRKKSLAQVKEREKCKKTSHHRPQCAKWFSRYSISKSGIWARWTSPFCRFSTSFSIKYDIKDAILQDNKK